MKKIIEFFKWFKSEQFPIEKHIDSRLRKLQNEESKNAKFKYEISLEEAIVVFNKLQVGKEYEVLDLVSGKWKKQTYSPPNEQETFEKMIHGIRYNWIRV